MPLSSPVRVDEADAESLKVEDTSIIISVRFHVVKVSYLLYIMIRMFITMACYTVWSDHRVMSILNNVELLTTIEN